MIDAGRMLILGLLAVGCGTEGRTVWAGTVDTLASGQIVVSNPEQGIWTDDTRWRLIEELRLGTSQENGPELFGRIAGMAVDGSGKMYVIDGQANELRVFDADGTHRVTTGGEGGGPGEFRRPVAAQFGPDGLLWIPDPRNNRISKFDTSGTFVTSVRQPGGFVILPWPGRVVRDGHYFGPIPRRTVDGELELSLVRHDAELNPIDTVDAPVDPVERDAFVYEGPEDRSMVGGVPYSPGFRWRISAAGTLWGMFTGEYRLFEMTTGGDTLRTITRAFTPLPVTSEDLDSAIASLTWFTDQGGTVDRSRIPDVKPATHRFLLDDEQNIWVAPVVPREQTDRVMDVFDADGRYLGRLETPFRVRWSPYPIFKDGFMYAVTTDDFDVPYIVRARIEQPGVPAPPGAGR